MTINRIILALPLLLLASCSTSSNLSRSGGHPASVPAAQLTQSSIVVDAKPGRVMRVRTTAYSDKENEKGGKYGKKTAIGSTLRYDKIKSAAADWSRFPLGTKFRIRGDSSLYVVDDYGSALVGTNTIDLYKPSLASMRDWGTRVIDIQIVEWGNYQTSLRVLGPRTHYAHCREMANEIVRIGRRS